MTSGRQSPAEIFYRLVADRRSIRRYEASAVPAETLDRVLSAARWAPSAHNRQPWRFAMLTAFDWKDRLALAMGERLRRDRLADGDSVAAIEQDVARSYAQAERTTQTLQRLGRSGGKGAVSAFGDLGILRLLLQVPDLGELRSFAAEVLGKLSEHEHEHKSEYLSTLACYFRENNSPQRASRLLHVHPNTVAYRIKRIEEITGLRLDNYRDRLIAQVALEILDALPEAQS